MPLLRYSRGDFAKHCRAYIHITKTTFLATRQAIITGILLRIVPMHPMSHTGPTGAAAVDARNKPSWEANISLFRPRYRFANPDGCGRRHFTDLEARIRRAAGRKHRSQSFAAEERVAIGEEIEQLLKKKRHGSNQHKRREEQNLAPAESGKTRDIAAKKAGFKNSTTYEQAKVVVPAAKAEPEKFERAKSDMNRTGRVHGPYKRVKAARQAYGYSGACSDDAP
jgi:hypothetical protein